MSDISAKILIVDDESSVRSLIASYLGLKLGYTVFTAESGQDALEFLKTRSVDLVISDINMPEMKGFTLLSHIKKEYPAIRRILMTAYSVQEYFELALAHDVGTIFIKSVPFNFEELSSLISSILSGDFFGAERYFRQPYAKQQFIIRKPDQIESDLKSIVAAIPFVPVNRHIYLVLVEMVTNALFYGARSQDPADKMAWSYDFELADHEAITIDLLSDENKYAIVITDTGGKLKKKDVLYWLSRQSAKDEQGVPLSIGDNHGRGLFIAWNYIDRLIINIDSLKKTEIVILMYPNGVASDNKPLFINEL